MIQTKQIIESNKDKFPDFEYYHSVIKVVEEKVDKSPDMSIESVKSLFEGMSKTIITRLQPELKYKSDAHEIFKQALDAINEHTFIERDFIRKSGALVLGIANIRNKRADISHGKAVPKELFSSSELAITIIQIADSMLSYILSIYFSIDLGFE